MSAPKTPRWMASDWDGGFANRHLPLDEATELLRGRQATRPDAPFRHPTGLQMQEVDCGQRRRRGPGERRES